MTTVQDHYITQCQPVCNNYAITDQTLSFSVDGAGTYMEPCSETKGSFDQCVCAIYRSVTSSWDKERLIYGKGLQSDYTGRERGRECGGIYRSVRSLWEI